MRGEILLKRDPVNTGPAEEAFLTAIAIARQQKAKSFELRAALSLAEPYQSTGRLANAHNVLARALEGFSPTPEFPEIKEAQKLLAALAETDEVKNAVASRQRRLKLQTSYAKATMLSRGFGSEEAKTAFIRAAELASQTDAVERFDAYYGLWVASLLRGELQSARQTAESFLCEANSAGRVTEAAVAHRNIGLTCLLQGDFGEAKTNIESVLRLHDPERDREVKFRFAADNAANATVYLGWLEWLFGNFGRARELVEQSVKLAVDSNHPSTLANVSHFKSQHTAAKETRCLRRFTKACSHSSRLKGRNLSSR
jgi:tetratricopeptide (TPR) repeat protein